jgi:hypothetical protein
VIDTRIYRLRSSTQARPLVCVCTSGDVAPPVQDSVDWTTATPQPLACCPSPVPLTATRALVVRSLRPHRRQRPHRSAHHRSCSRLRTAAPRRTRCGPGAESLVFAVTSRPHSTAAYPLLVRLHLNIATPHHPVRAPSCRKPPTKALRRCPARSPCRCRACRTTRTLHARAMASPSPPQCKPQSQRLLSAT